MLVQDLSKRISINHCRNLNLEKNKELTHIRSLFFSDKHDYSDLEKVNQSNITPLLMKPLSENKYEKLVSKEPVVHQTLNQSGIYTHISDGGELVWIRLMIPVLYSKKNLSTLSSMLYTALFDIVRDKYPKFNYLRLWNFIPKILDKTPINDLPINDFENYRQFNIGRQQAWEKSGPRDKKGMRRYPAATGIGTNGGPLIIEALITKSDVVDLENYRQIPAYRYSDRYGSKAPAFSRATARILADNTRPEIYIAGTASIVGENSIHPNDAKKQTLETINNISALISEKNLRPQLKNKYHPYSFDEVYGFRVHIRNQKDYKNVKSAVSKYIEPGKVIYVADSICRPDLLVEIECVI